MCLQIFAEPVAYEYTGNSANSPQHPAPKPKEHSFVADATADPGESHGKEDGAHEDEGAWIESFTFHIY